MFNLDQSISEWRRQMVAGGIKSPQVLDELESHLRDDVEEQEREGATVQRAFEIAVRRLGQAAALECEFEKVGETREAPERVKNVFFALAGIPNHYLNESMNTSSNIEARWATYLKGGLFVMPAIVFWILSAVFVVPKLQQICADAGIFNYEGWPLIESCIRTTLFFSQHGVLIGGGLIVMLALLEWRSRKWPRYRRATIGAGVFLLNGVILFSIFVMFVTALLAAPALLQVGQRNAAIHAK
jgi:hypothetical protein